MQRGKGIGLFRRFAILQRSIDNVVTQDFDDWFVTWLSKEPSLTHRLMEATFTLNKLKLLRDVNSLAVRGVYLPSSYKVGTHSRLF